MEAVYTIPLSYTSWGTGCEKDLILSGSRMSVLKIAGLNSKVPAGAVVIAT